MAGVAGLGAVAAGVLTPRLRWLGRCATGGRSPDPASPSGCR